MDDIVWIHYGRMVKCVNEDNRAVTLSPFFFIFIRLSLANYYPSISSYVIVFSQSSFTSILKE